MHITGGCIFGGVTDEVGDVRHGNALEPAGGDEGVPEVVEGVAWESGATAEAGKFDGQSGPPFEVEAGDPSFVKGSVPEIRRFYNEFLHRIFPLRRVSDCGNLGFCGTVEH